MTALQVEVQGVSVVVGGVRVLGDVSLTAAPGRIFGLVGPNGAGKTTLLRAIAGSLTPARGRVLVGGVDVRDMGNRQRALMIASVAQTPVVPEGFTAGEVVLMGRNPHLGLLQWEGRRDFDSALEAMELTNTRHLAGRPIESLSGGERQRIFIARALAQRSSVLLLDEPTTHLDIGVQVAVMNTLLEVMRERPLTVVAAMHDLTLAAQYCDELAIMSAGSIRAAGAASAVLTRDSIRDSFGVEAVVLEHPGRGGLIVVPGSGPRLR